MPRSYIQRCPKRQMHTRLGGRLSRHSPSLPALRGEKGLGAMKGMAKSNGELTAGARGSTMSEDGMECPPRGPYASSSKR